MREAEISEYAEMTQVIECEITLTIFNLLIKKDSKKCIKIFKQNKMALTAIFSLHAASLRKTVVSYLWAYLDIFFQTSRHVCSFAYKDKYLHAHFLFKTQDHIICNEFHVAFIYLSVYFRTLKSI